MRIPKIADVPALVVGPDFVLVGGFFDGAGPLALPGLARLQSATLPPGIPVVVEAPTEIEVLQGARVKIRVRYRSGSPASVRLRWFKDG